jgi:hypothetical protein
LDQPNQNQNYRYDQKNVDEAAHCVGRDESKQPRNDQDEGDGVKHTTIWF